LAETSLVSPDAGKAADDGFTSTSTQGLLDSARELWGYRELFFFLAWRDITIRYRQTLLGAAWAVLQPVVTMAIFTVLFGMVVKVPTNGIPVPVFYLSALLPWIYFSATITTVSNSLVANALVIKKVYFPRIVLPASGALVGLVDLVIGATLLMMMMAYYHVLSWRVLWWLPLTALLWLFSFAVGAFLSAVNVRFRDVKHAIPFVVQIWLFVTPVIYPATAVPGKLRWLISLNPLTGIVESFRVATAPWLGIDWRSLWISVALTLVILTVSLAYFRRAEERFTDIV
jgi:lipopolysaccharide transport system permease protein